MHLKYLWCYSVYISNLKESSQHEKIFYFALASAVAFTSFPFPIASNYQNVSAATDSCPDAEFIFARGSGSSLGDEDARKWREEIANALSFNARFSFYELGSKTYNGTSYPAVPIGFEDTNTVLNTLSAVLANTKRFGAFNRSVNQGVTELIGRIETVSRSCPSTKFILGGYSQGAIVLGRALSKLDSSKVVYVATF